MALCLCLCMCLCVCMCVRVCVCVCVCPKPVMKNSDCAHIIPPDSVSISASLCVSMFETADRFQRNFVRNLRYLMPPKLSTL